MAWTEPFYFKNIGGDKGMNSKIFINPIPITMDEVYNASLSHLEMESPSHVGGGIIAIAIVACGGKLGSATIVTAGTTIVTVAA